ncbi:Uncharacterised protein [Enterobacter hormaechei]|nr:Uncharacterised protein [Enterobacter hormaechei]
MKTSIINGSEVSRLSVAIQLALLDWGSTIQKNTATIDILDIPLNVDGVITYNETDEDGMQRGPYVYRISTIETF